jgi:hypothetical protein
MVMRADRDDHGRYLPGHPGGPGRPRRAVEQEYLAVLADAVPLQQWKKIVQRAVKDAAAGDPRARRWIGEHLLGRQPGSLTELAAVELAGTKDDAIIARAAGMRGSVAGQKLRNRAFQYPDLDRGRSAGRGHAGGGAPDPQSDLEARQPDRNGHPQ